MCKSFIEGDQLINAFWNGKTGSKFIVIRARWIVLAKMKAKDINQSRKPPLGKSMEYE